MDKRSLHSLSVIGVALAVLAGNSLAAEKPQLSLGVALYGYGVESTETQNRLAGTQVFAAFQHKFSGTLSTNLETALSLETGAYRYRFSDEFTPKKGFRLQSAEIKWEPFEKSGIRIGVVDQDRWENPLLVTNQSFPSAVEIVTVPFGDFFASLEAIQSYASDTSNFLPWTDWSGTQPMFFMERVTLGFAPNTKFQGRTYVSHYQFTNLSPNLAYQSAFLGNHSLGSLAANSQFRFPFRGFEVGTTWSWQVRPSFKPELTVQALANPEAADGSSRAWRVALGSDVLTSEDFNLHPSVEVFRTEADVVPAVYNSRNRGHNNREGYGIGITSQFAKHGIEVRAEWFESRPIETTFVQSSQQWLFFQLRTDYDIL